MPNVDIPRYKSPSSSFRSSILSEKEIFKLKEELRKDVVNIAVLGAEKILKHTIDQKAQNDLIADIVKQL